MIKVNEIDLPFQEDQTVEQLIKKLRSEPEFRKAFELAECIIMRNGMVIPPARRHEVYVEDKDDFSVFPMLSGG